MYQVSTNVPSLFINNTSNRSGNQTTSRNDINQPYKRQTPAPITETPQDRPSSEGTCGGHGAVSGSYLRVRDLGEDGGQTLRQQQSAPQQGLRWTYRLILNHSLPLFLPAATLPPLSLCLFLSSSLSLSACLRWRRGKDRTTMALWWLMVTMVLTPSSHPQLSAALLLLFFAFPPSTLQEHQTGTNHCRQLKTAPLLCREPSLQLRYIN